MKQTLLLISCWSLCFCVACGNTVNQPSYVAEQQAPTVPPEIEPAVPLNDTPASTIGSVKDTTRLKADSAYGTPGTQKDTTHKNPQKLSEQIKTESNKVVRDVKDAVKTGSQTVKQEAGKAAEAVKKAGADLKKELKKK